VLNILYTTSYTWRQVDRLWQNK